MEELHDFPSSRIGTSKSSQSFRTPGEEHVRVVVRIRPPLSREIEYFENETINCLEDKRSFQILENKTSHIVTYDKVYDQYASQEHIFFDSGTVELIERAIEGFSATIFAFGQTGSGKTFTMTGAEIISPDSQGIIPRSLAHIYHMIKQNSLRKFKVRTSFLEVYNEQMYDLLTPSNTILPLRWRKKQGFYAENAIIVECAELEHSLFVLKEGLKNRTVKSHALNDRSSRSHSILTVYIDSENTDQSNQTAGQKFGKISFVDLAGSERVKQSKTQGEALTEALNINKSLLVLGNCISVLADAKHKSGHIPYRDSKLTKLLMDSLGGNGLTLMIACISLSKFSLSESLQTLRYASRAKKIKNKPIVRESSNNFGIEKLKNELFLLRKENFQLKEKFTRSLSSSLPTPSGFSNEEKENLSKMIQSYAMELDSLKYENIQLAESKQRTEHMYANLMRETESIRGRTEEAVVLPPLSTPNPSKSTAKKMRAKQKQVSSFKNDIALPSLPSAPTTHSIVPDLNALKEDMNRLNSEIAKYTRAS